MRAGRSSKTRRGRRAGQGRVGILTGSRSDLATVEAVRDTLAELGVESELRVLSAHRSPELTVEWVRGAETRGIEVIVACAGMANHLAGTVAAHTPLPVIGVPLASGGLGGLDSLLSTVQMPPGVPVATVSIDGARNAAFLAARILGIKYAAVREHVEAAAAAERRRYAAGARVAPQEEAKPHAGVAGVGSARAPLPPARRGTVEAARRRRGSRR
jgi:5-(carboxyamino)imidazole ribonucleotide mutase